MNAKKNKMKKSRLRFVVSSNNTTTQLGIFYLVLGWRATLDLDGVEPASRCYSAWFLLKILHLLKK